MSAREVADRLGAAVRDVADWCFFPVRRRPLPTSRLLPGASSIDGSPGFRMTDMLVGEWAGAPPQVPEHKWLARLRAKADVIAAHRLSLFDLQDFNLGDRINWNHDPKHGIPAPMRYARGIDYRDFAVTGDCKFVWEPNRHQQFVVLARAYRASGDPSYAAAALDQWDSWLRQCPYGLGMNWRSAMELGIRLINWVWTLDLVCESELVTERLYQRILTSVYFHLRDTTRQYSSHSSAGNHLVGEAAGVYIATSYFPDLRNAARWNEQSYRILCEQILRQTHPDGGWREQALGYLYFVLQFFMLSGLVARQRGLDFPPEYWWRIEKMLEFAGAMLEGGEPIPVFGDCDDGCVLDLGLGHGDFRSLLAVGAVLFGRGDFRTWAGAYPEPARWMLGRLGRERFDALPHAASCELLASRAFPDAGYYLLQCGCRDAADRISVVFDCGDLGFPATAGHGHADALSFTLRAFGTDVLVDSGTYDYYTYSTWRDYFRSTQAHNTAVVDGENQSVILGRFLWGHQARARCLAWQPAGAGGSVVGEHDGYARLRDPVIHRRTLELDGAQRRLTVRDDILARGEHDVEVFFHLAETCRVTGASENRFEINVGPGSVTMQLDPRLAIRTLVGSEDPIGGWVSRGYHRKTPSTTIIGRLKTVGAVSLTHEIRIGNPRGA